MDNKQVTAAIVDELQQAWNAGDVARFAQPFAEDADFVNIRGEHHRTRDAIARGHQSIFASIYTDSVVRLEVAAVRSIATGVLLTHVRSVLNVPAGPLAGEHHALFSLVLVPDTRGGWIAALLGTLVT